MTVNTRRAVAADQERCLALIETLTGQTQSERWRETFDALIGEE